MFRFSFTVVIRIFNLIFLYFISSSYTKSILDYVTISVLCVLVFTNAVLNVERIELEWQFW